MMGRWSYPHTEPFPFGPTVTYEKGIGFVDGPWTIEDWGCGTAWARQFVKQGKYVGIDGSRSRWTDKVVDLAEYTSKAEGIFMRHVLEHNVRWSEILRNAVASFQKRLAVVMFIPFGPVTEPVGMTNDVPDIRFKKEDLTDHFGRLSWHEETFKTATQCGWEHIFFVEK